MNFETLRRANDARQKLWKGSDAATVEFRALEVGGETGELLEAVKKMLRAQLGIQGTTLGLDAVADELGDVIIAADLLAGKLGLDLGDCVRAKFNKTSDKYELPIKL